MTEVLETSSHPLELAGEEEKNRVMQEVFDIIKEYNEDPRLTVSSRGKEVQDGNGSATLQRSQNELRLSNSFVTSDTLSNKEIPIPPPKPHKESVIALSVQQQEIIASSPTPRESQATITVAFKDTAQDPIALDITQPLTAAEKEQNKYQSRKSKRVTEISRTTNLNAKEGFLIKRGEKRKNWKMRWFVLKPDGYYYFETPKEWRPKNVIPTKEITLIAKISDEELERLKPPPPYNYFFFFKVCTAKRELVCCATSIDELEDWVYLGQQALLLHEKIKKLDEQEKLNSM